MSHRSALRLCCWRVALAAVLADFQKMRGFMQQMSRGNMPGMPGMGAMPGMGGIPGLGGMPAGPGRGGPPKRQRPAKKKKGFGEL